MLTGADIRRYRKTIGLSQIDFARRLGLSQSGLSQLENGRIAVCDDHVHQLQDRFSGRKTDLTFDSFLRQQAATGEASRRALSTDAGKHLTLTVWRWEDGYDLAQMPASELAVDLVTTHATSQATIAFQMTQKSTHWLSGEIFVFEECRPADLLDRDVCLVQFKPPRSQALKTVLAIARSASARSSARQLTPIAPRCPAFDASDKVIRILMRAVFRGHRL